MGCLYQAAETGTIRLHPIDILFDIVRLPLITNFLLIGGNSALSEAYCIAMGCTFSTQRDQHHFWQESQHHIYRLEPQAQSCLPAILTRSTILCSMTRMLAEYTPPKAPQASPTRWIQGTSLIHTKSDGPTDCLSSPRRYLSADWHHSANSRLMVQS